MELTRSKHDGTKEEKQPSSYDMDPYCKGELLMHHTEGWHGDEEGLRDDLSPLVGCREELQTPPHHGGGSYGLFRGDVIGCLGFWYQGALIGEEARQEGVHDEV